MDKDIKLNLGNIRGLRAKKRLTGKQMAQMLGVCYTTYRYWENGIIDDIPLKKAKKISNIFGQTIDDIFFTE